jgi:UDP-3-O-[3-hydroxymyristoyl] glucosamine N-acyltransferase
MTFSISLGDLAQRYHLEFVGDPTIEVSGIANLRDAHSAQLAFLFSSVYRPMLNETAAAAVVIQ